MTRIPLLLLAVALTVGSLTTPSQARKWHPHYYKNYNRAAAWAQNNRSWHHVYGHTQYGMPVALVVPPTANFHTDFSWGVGRTRMSPTNHQFGRPIPVPGVGTNGFYATPVWPSDTNQFGVYHVRGPW